MLQLKDNEKVTLSVSGVDAKGNPAPLPNAPAWSASDPSVLAALQPSADGLTCDVIAGVPGTVQVNVTDVLADGSTVTGTLDITVVAGDATQITIVAGTPTAQ